MSACRKPLKKSFLIAIVVFLVLLCLALSFFQYLRYRSTLYNRYAFYIENVLRYTAAGIDVDDLAECIRTGEESEKFRALQRYLDGIRENTSMHFLYCIVPLNTEPTDNIMNVIAAVTREEYETVPDELVHLGMLSGDAYSPATAKKYLDAYNSGELSFFEEVSQWGDDYTGLLPLYDSQGNRVAALCMDIDILELHTALRSNTVSAVLLVSLLGALFAALFLGWTRHNVIKPIEQLENSAVRFASTCLEQRDPDTLVMDLPEIRTGNEVESLAQAVLQMSAAMRSYLTNFVHAEGELERMTVLANKDGLTGVRNKNAYNAYILELKSSLEAEPFPFAILMLDLNYLKRINDTYGHEKGDNYLKKCCRMICTTFSHSPVFRVGGDEFTVVLLGQDYENRAQLLQGMRREFDASDADASLPPWERLSIAVGMAEYRAGEDTVEDVLERADKNMYREKRRMKIER